VTISSPLDGASYSPSSPTTFNLSASVSDAESSDSQLNYQWQTLLHHNDHNHVVATDTNHASTVELSPIGCDGINIYYYRIILTVTDPVERASRLKVLAQGWSNPETSVEWARQNLTGEDKTQAKENTEAARLWFNGLRAISERLTSKSGNGVKAVYDLSATPSFLSGSGYREGTLFPWTMSDFSLMDAIECGIVKLPRVPVAENIPGDDMPMFRNLWENIRKDMPKKGRGKAEGLDPLALPTRLQTALQALYGHYEKTFRLWEQEKISVPPCFIIVCNNTSTSKLVYDYISGFHRENEDGSTTLENGRLALFRNFDEHGNPLPRPNTLLIDSEQLESGEGLDDDFRTMAADEIERFRRERVERSGDRRAADNITEQELLREVMNTVGRPGTLGGSIRCVVSVSMLTEGWDANTVTHVLGVRAFGTQLLCEQVIGRALRRQSYELNEDGPNKGLFNVEYADVLGIPFDFTAKPVVAPPQPPRETVQVKAMRPERDALEIRFPRVAGYRVELPEERLTAKFTDDSTLVLTPDLVGPTVTRNAGIIGQAVDLNLEHLEDTRTSTLLFHLTQLVIPGRPALHALHGELTTERRRRIGAPDDLAVRLVASAFHHDQVSNIEVARTHQPCSMWMNVVGPRHLRRTATLPANHRPAHGQREMNDFGGQQAVFGRRVGIAGHVLKSC